MSDERIDLHTDEDAQLVGTSPRSSEAPLADTDPLFKRLMALERDLISARLVSIWRSDVRDNECSELKFVFDKDGKRRELTISARVGFPPLSEGRPSDQIGILTVKRRALPSA